VELRNKFIHFVPQGWSLNVNGLPHICLTILEIIKFLSWESGNILWHNERLKHKAESILYECESNSKKIKHAYEFNL
jgi:hypothetical protein